MDMMFCPSPWYGTPDKFLRFDVYPWVSLLPKDKKIYCCFWQTWDTIDLPPGYDFYIISYHIENVNLLWLNQQRSMVDGKFIVLFPGNLYGYELLNTDFITYNNWHLDIEKIISWHGVADTTPIKKNKFSAVCNRTTQSKIWVTTKLLESSSPSLILHNPYFLQDKNVHSWQKTGNTVLDNLTEIYLKKYKDMSLTDDFDQYNYQIKNSNPWQPLYTDTALHFTNGSFHYSHMEGPGENYLYPGPDIDEKILKCLVAGIPFVACGQFEIYKTLSKLGLEFDYGFDLSWDSDPRNLDRFQKICELIDDLDDIPTDELTAMTKKSTAHNKEFVCKKGFFSKCQQKIKLAVKKIFASIETR